MISILFNSFKMKNIIKNASLFSLWIFIMRLLVLSMVNLKIYSRYNEFYNHNNIIFPNNGCFNVMKMGRETVHYVNITLIWTTRNSWKLGKSRFQAQGNKQTKIVLT